MGLFFRAFVSGIPWLAKRSAKQSLYMMMILIGGWVGMTTQAKAVELVSTPIASYQDITGHRHSTAGLTGHPTLLFIVTTWCSTCSAGLQALDAHANQLRTDGLHLLILQTFQNEQGMGPSIGQFVSKWAPHLDTDNVMVGRSSKGLEEKYNPQHYTDLYYLIDPKGHIQSIDSAPSFTIDKILRFADNMGRRGSQ